MDYKEAMQNNTYPRINWSVILGISLNQFVAQQLGAGQSKEEIIKTISGLCVGKNLPFKDYEIANRIEIGVSARIGEIASEKKAYFGNKDERAIKNEEAKRIYACIACFIEKNRTHYSNAGLIECIESMCKKQLKEVEP
jgi:hypothetical protein